MRRRVRSLALLGASAVTASGAKPNELAGLLLFVGAAVAALVVLGLPVGLALHAFRRDWIAAQAGALDRRPTACAVSGAGLVVATLFIVAVLAEPAAPLAVLVVVAATGWGLVGFAGCARRHGERMLGTSSDAAVLRPLVLGWLARAGLCAVPVVWPFLATYLVVTAFGVPLVALFGKKRPSMDS